jgi:hypothetical protein
MQVGDVIENEFLTPGEGRDWELGVIAEPTDEYGYYKVARIGKDAEGYYWTNQWELREASQLRLATIKLNDTGLEL